MAVVSGPVKYLSIYEEIAALIKGRTLTPGERIPSENEIMHRYGVSNTTARKVLERLENDGLVRRIKGRGTFVRESPVFRPASEILSFSENMRLSGLVPSTRVLEINLREGSMTSGIGLKNHRLEGPYYEIRRLRFGGEDPIMLEVRRIRTRFLPELSSRDLTGSLYEIYEQNGIQVAEVLQSLSSVILDDDILALFNLEGYAPGIRLNGASYDQSGELIELEESVYRGDRYQFLVSAGDR
jgi:GntR family transcriptional regulator